MSAFANCFRIVLTGGPGGGKTTAADLFRREIGEQIVVVPEAATILFAGGFPRSTVVTAVEAGQTAIYSVQKQIENAQQALYPHRILLCDRGTVDSSIYWPHGEQDFFAKMNTSLEKEFSRYDAVVFFQTAAAGNVSIEGGNPHRNESLEQARALDKRLYEVWSQHHNFYYVNHNHSFLGKMNKGLKILKTIVDKLHPQAQTQKTQLP